MAWTRRWILRALVLAGLVAVAGCASPTPSVPGSGDDADGDGTPQALDPDVAPVTAGDWYRPGADVTWQWQLQPGDSGGLNTTYDVDVYDIDLFDNSAADIAALQAQGRRVLCYFSAGSYEDFRSDAGRFAESELGNTLDGFADERWLDIRSTSVHAAMAARLDLAVEKGCDGVEPDNVGAYQNDTGFPLTATDQLAYNRFLANVAHQRGLAVALKNDLEQIPDLVAYFDLALNEECHEFDECSALSAFVDAGKPVFVAEYAELFVSDADARDAMCASSQDQGVHTLILPLDLDDAFRRSCDD